MSGNSNGLGIDIATSQERRIERLEDRQESLAVDVSEQAVKMQTVIEKLDTVIEKMDDVAVSVRDLKTTETGRKERRDKILKFLIPVGSAVASAGMMRLFIYLAHHY